MEDVKRTLRAVRSHGLPPRAGVALIRALGWLVCDDSTRDRVILWSPECSFAVAINMTESTQ